MRLPCSPTPFRLVISPPLIARRSSQFSIILSADTNTRQDATQKLETASRENYVRRLSLSRSSSSSCGPLTLARAPPLLTARIHADALIGPRQRKHAAPYQKRRRIGSQKRPLRTGTSCFSLRGASPQSIYLSHAFCVLLLLSSWCIGEREADGV